VHLLDYVGCPGDRVRLPPSSITCPIPFNSRRPLTGRWRIAMQRVLPNQTWIRRPGSTQREGRVYDFGDNLDTTTVLSSYASSVAPPAYTSSSAAMPDSGGDDIRTLIRKELSHQLLLHLGAMVEQLVAAIRGACTSQQAPQASITFNFI
ncbi:hypothetical protein Taro_028334, partial [Colocasia esculenta]|nr:hypothetical protein [Colocasia esculenta]